MPDLPVKTPQPSTPAPAAAPAGPPMTTVNPGKFGASGSVAAVVNPNGTKSYTAVITGEVLAPGNYIQLLDTLYHAKKGDTVTIKIASPGGMVETGSALLTAFENTQAHVKTIGIGLVASIAAIIWLAGHEHEMLPGATLMVHGPSGLQMGKVSSIKEECEQIGEYFEYMLKKLSKGILTDEQLNRVLTKREDLFIPGDQLKNTTVVSDPSEVTLVAQTGD